MKIDVTKKIVNLQGKPIRKDSKEEDDFWTYGDFLGELVLSLTDGGAYKKFKLAKKFADAKKEVELDKNELAILKSAVQKVKLFKVENLNTMFNGQIEELLENLDDKKPIKK